MNDRHEAHGFEFAPTESGGERRLEDLFRRAHAPVAALALRPGSVQRILAGVLADGPDPARPEEGPRHPGSARPSPRWSYPALTAAAILVLLLGGSLLLPDRGPGGPGGSDPSATGAVGAMTTATPQDDELRTAPLVISPDKRHPPSSPRFIPLYWRFARADAVVRARVAMVEGLACFELIRVHREGLPDHSLHDTPIEVEGSRMMGHARVSSEEGEELLLLLRLVERPDPDGQGIVRRYMPSTAVGDLGVLTIHGGRLDTFSAGLYDLSTFADPKVTSISLSDLETRLSDIAESTSTIPGLLDRFDRKPQQDNEVFADLLIAAAKTLDRRSEKGAVRASLLRARAQLDAASDPPEEVGDRERLLKALNQTLEAFPE